MLLVAGVMVGDGRPLHGNAQFGTWKAWHPGGYIDTVGNLAPGMELTLLLIVLTPVVGERRKVGSEGNVALVRN